MLTLFRGNEHELVQLAEATDEGYADFFGYSKTIAESEGIVLKHKASHFIGSTRRSVDNPLWLKVKWRRGRPNGPALAGNYGTGG